MSDKKQYHHSLCSFGGRDSRNMQPCTCPEGWPKDKLAPADILHPEDAATTFPVLDVGYVTLIESWGSEERIIEAARMSTAKGFQGWGPSWLCNECGVKVPGAQVEWQGPHSKAEGTCNGIFIKQAGDEKLLAYLYKHKHMTPFEMAGMIIEVKAPIFVFREWHRHRTQGYNEMSARYTPLPDENYYPTVGEIQERILNAGNNKQVGGVAQRIPTVREISDWWEKLDAAYSEAQACYAQGLAAGIPKELARLCVPVGRYSRMRATANLRNWLQFLELRDAPGAQWEIREYARAVGQLIKRLFPRTYTLFNEERKS